MDKFNELKRVRSRLRSSMKIVKKSKNKVQLQKKHFFINELIGYMAFFEEPAKIAVNRVQMKPPYKKTALHKLLS
jgi:hypothetical protein